MSIRTELTKLQKEIEALRANNARDIENMSEELRLREIRKFQLDDMQARPNWWREQIENIENGTIKELSYEELLAEIKNMSYDQQLVYSLKILHGNLEWAKERINEIEANERKGD